MDIATIGSKIENRVANDLTRSMISDIAAPGCLVQIDPASCKLSPRNQDVIQAVPRTSANGNHMKMLDQ